MTINRAMGALRSPAAGMAAVLALGLAAAGPAGATAFGTLAFTQPTGVVGPTDEVPVYLTLTLDQTSTALTATGYDFMSGGPTEQELIDAGFDTSQAYTQVLNVYFECSGTFTSVCADPPPYQFDFQFDNFAVVDIAPGGDYTYLFGKFTPSPTPAPPGTYTFYNTGIFVQVIGSNTNGGQLRHSFQIAQTCTNGDDSCAFTRTVVGGAVPEPATWAVMLLGFGGIGAVLRRRRGGALA